MSHRRDPEMVLPDLDQENLAHRIGGYLRDARVPDRLDFDGDVARPVGGPSTRRVQCPTGRHLWDALIVERDVYDEDVVTAVAKGDRESVTQFRMTLTCVRCGAIEYVAGYATEWRGLDGVDPVPLQAGGLRAQQIDRSRIGAREEVGGNWIVYDGADPVGRMSWGITPRGRHYIAGRLATWPGGETEQAPTAIACLRKIAKRRNRQDPPEPTKETNDEV